MRTISATASSPPAIWAATSRTTACRSWSRPAATPSISMRRACCRTSRRAQFPGAGAGGGTVPARGHPRRGDRHRDVRRERRSHELLRLAIPRRVYTQSHIDYVVEAILEVNERKEKIRGMEIVEEPPFLRHFSARMRQL